MAGEATSSAEEEACADGSDMVLFSWGALVFQACGGDSPPEGCPPGTTGTAPSCVAIPPPCTQTTLYSEAEPMPPQTLVYFDFSVPDSGRLDITLDWTFAHSPVGFYLVPANTCNLEEFNARSCNFLIRSEPSAVKPRKLSERTSAPATTGG